MSNIPDTVLVGFGSKSRPVHVCSDDLIDDATNGRIRYLRADLHTTKVASLEAKLAAIVEALQSLAKFDHDYDCASCIGDHPGPCDCFVGFARAALAKQAALETKGG